MEEFFCLIVNWMKANKLIVITAIVGLFSDMIFHWHKLVLEWIGNSLENEEHRKENYNLYKEGVTRQRRKIFNEPIYIWDDSTYENKQKLYKKYYIKNIPLSVLGDEKEKRIRMRKNMGVAILGKAGVGKSTFLRSLFLKHTTGFRMFMNRIRRRRYYFYKISDVIVMPKLLTFLENDSLYAKSKFIFLDGLDEVNDEDYQKVTLQIKRIFELNYTVILSCRKDVYETIKKIEPDILSLISCHYEIQQWTPQQSNSYIKKYAKYSKTKIIEEIKPYQEKEKYADFFTTPLELSLLIFILERETQAVEECVVANRYDLYNKFIHFWAKREISKNKDQELQVEQILHMWSTMAFQLFRKSDRRGLDMNNQTIKKLILKEKKLKKYVGGIVQVEQKEGGKKVRGFSHLRITEFLVAYYFYNSIHKYEGQIVEAMLFEYTHSVTSFIKERFKIMTDEELKELFFELISILLNMPPYKAGSSLDMYKKELGVEMKNALNNLSEDEKRIMKNQIIYFISRISSANCNFSNVGNQVIEEVYKKELDEYNRRSAAIGAAILGNVDIELLYANELINNPESNLRDRSFTMVYYQDIRNKSPFAYEDDNTSDWENARCHRLERLQSSNEKDIRLRLFDLVTILNFTKSRMHYFVPEKKELNIVRNCNIEIDSYDDRKKKMLFRLKKELILLWEKLLEENQGDDV